MVRFRYVGRGGGGGRRAADEVGVVLPGEWCLDSAPGGWKAVHRPGHGHSAANPCAVLRRASDALLIPEDARHFGLPLADMMRQARGVGRRELYREVVS